ncbi:MAG TPA: hypothetical protein ENI53_00980 [Thermoplasmatales archaeon]|nr:hypothetical protein [Thermoplasmatales archaeon]
MENLSKRKSKRRIYKKQLNTFMIHNIMDKENNLSASHNVSKEKVGVPLHNTPWLNRCPVCKSGKLVSVTKKRFFGLAKSECLECNKCNAVFIQKDQGFQLVKVLDISNPIWQLYGKQVLTEREWKNIAYGGMSDARQKEADLEYWLTQLKEGKIHLQIAGESPIILKKGEELQLFLPDISLLEPRVVRTGGYGGPSIRVAKGIYFRVGGFRAESHEELKNIDQGTLTLTTKRLVFTGIKRTVNIDLRGAPSTES